MMNLSRIASIDDLAALAKRRLPAFAYSYLDEGAGDGFGVARNKAAFARIALLPHRLRGNTGALEATLFDRSYGAPFGMAPVGMANLAWPGTDLAIARLCEKRNIPYVLSTMATTSIEEVVRVAPEVTWFQLYPSSDDATTTDLMRRAQDAGVRVLVLTVDVPAPPLRQQSIRQGISIPFRFTPRVLLELARHPRWSLATLWAGGPPQLANYVPYLKTASVNHAGRLMGKLNKHGLTWNDLRRVRDAWPHTLIVKGILAPADATEAVAAGANAIWVSNHGGRQLSALPTPIDMLPVVREAVPSDVPVLLDSGIRSGEDVVRALALGASFVFCGRAFIYGAAAAGVAGVNKAFDLLFAETTSTLAQIGGAAVVGTLIAGSF